MNWKELFKSKKKREEEKRQLELREARRIEKEIREEKLREESLEVLGIHQSKPFNDTYNLAYNKPLFDWIRKQEEKYNEECSTEFISQLFMRLHHEDNDELKKLAYMKMRGIGFKKHFVKKLFTRFDELRSNVSRI